MRLTPAIIATLLLVGCNMPYDPGGTLNRVRGGTLRAGVAVNEPWTRILDGRPAGVEVVLLGEFAAELGAAPDWIVGSESQLLAALEEKELDVVIGGLTEDTPWRSRIGLTGPYLTTQLIVGVPNTQSLISDYRGKEIAVRKGQVAVAAHVRKKGGIPIPFDEPSKHPGPVAADRWQIQAWGLQPCPIHLHKDEHVIAVPPGENEWLMTLERFLNSHEERIQEILRAKAVR